MKPSEPTSLVGPYIGHVKNGVVVLDGKIPLREGQAVRIEPLAPDSESPANEKRTAEQLQRMQELFAKWDEEDSQTSDDAKEAFHQALEQNRGLSFRTPKMD